MDKMNRAIHEIRTMDSLAAKDQWLNRIHPLVKLFLTIVYIAAVVSFDKYDIMGLSGMAVFLLLLFEAGEVSFVDALRRLRIVLPLVCVVGIFNPFFDKNPVAVIGAFTVTGGMLSMLTLMLKGVFTVLASCLLIATTTIEKICYALRLLHLPKLFVTQILLIYRYISVLLAEANRMTQAYALRAPGQRGVRYSAWGSFAGQLLLRTMERAGELYESMCLRGYRGEFYYGRKQKLRGTDIGFGAAFLALILVFRLCPVFVLIGRFLCG